jgi:HlyD family secretion protein
MTRVTEPNSPQPDVAPQRSSGKGWFVGMIVMLAAGVAGAMWYLRPSHDAQAAPRSTPAASEASADNQSDEAAVTVQVVHPAPGGITRTSAQVGSVHAFEEADLYAKVSGYLKTLNVDIGDRVKEGAELAVIDDPELIKERDHASAVLRQSKAAVKQAQAAVTSFEASAERAAAEVARYTSTRRFREKELARYEALYQQRAVPKSVVDEEEEHLDSAKAAEMAARAAVAEAKAKVEQAKADLLGAEATVQVSDATLQKMDELVKYLTIRSPYNGVVTKRNVHPGDFIRSAADGIQPPLLHVARTDKLRIVTYIPDRDVPYVDIGDRADVMLDALNATITGKVWRFADSEDPESRTMRTEILYINQDGKVRQGMFGQARVILEQANAALSIPSHCIAGESKNGKAAVFVVRDGKAKKTEVKVGADDGLHSEIVQGLGPKDSIIENVNAVQDGTPVIVPESTEQAAKAH